MRKINELSEWHQRHIRSLFERSDYSFSEYLADNNAEDLGKFCEKLYGMGVDFAPCIETSIVGWKETESESTDGQPGREYFILVE
jgi:hypothetical protein